MIYCRGGRNVHRHIEAGGCLVVVHAVARAVAAQLRGSGFNFWRPLAFYFSLFYLVTSIIRIVILYHTTLECVSGYLNFLFPDPLMSEYLIFQTFLVPRHFEVVFLPAEFDLLHTTVVKRKFQV